MAPHRRMLFARGWGFVKCRNRNTGRVARKQNRNGNCALSKRIVAFAIVPRRGMCFQALRVCIAKSEAQTAAGQVERVTCSNKGKRKTYLIARLTNGTGNSKNDYKTEHTQ